MHYRYFTLEQRDHLEPVATLCLACRGRSV
jgi:hypothetical protein